MINFKSWVVTTVQNDATLSTLLKDGGSGINIFPVDVDIQPEQFPCIVYQDVSWSVLSVPQGMHVGGFQMDIYSIVNSQEVETIYTRLAQVFNFKDSTTQTLTGTLWWIREQHVRDMHDTQRRIWRKVVDLKAWYSNSDFT